MFLRFKQGDYDHGAFLSCSPAEILPKTHFYETRSWPYLCLGLIVIGPPAEDDRYGV